LAISIRRSHGPLSLVTGAEHPDVGDGELARGLAAGAGWATTNTWNRYAPMVLMMAARALGSESEAEDIAQEVFHRVFRKAKTLRDPDRLRSFIFSFAIRILKTELRRKRTRGWLSFQEPETLVDLACGTLDFESRDLLRRFYALLDRLKPRDRLVFSLRHMEAMTVEEISTSMELSTSTVKRSLGHATEKLSRWIETDPEMDSLLDRKGWK
jgi:RNA polymerase sigma-70 factor (ECF subfamily)